MCGIVGVYNLEEASKIAYLCLYALQHRGQESCGITSGTAEQLHTFRAMGLVNDAIHEKTFAALPGRHAIGQVRYSTAGSSNLANAQPFLIDFAGGPLAAAHNGNLTNALTLRKELEADGAIFQSNTDTEVIMHLVARSKKNELSERIVDALQKVKGAYCLVFLTKDKMIAVRDPKGFRPLVIGKKDSGYVVASESCALDLIDAQFHCEVEPGEMIVFADGKMRSSKPLPQSAHAPCIFEYIYFARPDSHLFGRSTYEIRKGFGRQLAKEQPPPAGVDMVIPVPDSGVPAAIGYSEQSGLPFQMGLIRNHYVGRTFIEPEEAIRHFGVKIKLNPVRELLEGKRVVVVDDSIVRGTTSMKIVKMLREKGGAKQVHLRISSPPIAWPCFYGINTPTRQELIAANQNFAQIQKFITADSLGYLSLSGLRWFQNEGKENFCNACFSGNYTEELTDHPEIAAMAQHYGK